MAPLEELLRDSVDCYQHMLEAMLQLAEEFEQKSPTELRDGMEFLADLQSAAARADEQLLAVLSEGQAAAHPLIQQRLQLIEKIVEQNRLISSQAHGIMAVVSAELSQLRDGRAAVSGYAPNQETRGKRVREAC